MHGRPNPQGDSVLARKEGRTVEGELSELIVMAAGESCAGGERVGGDIILGTLNQQSPNGGNRTIHR